MWLETCFLAFCGSLKLPVDPCVPLLPQYLEKYWTYFHQTFTFGSGMIASKFWGQKVKVEAHGRSNMLENALFGLVNAMS